MSAVSSHVGISADYLTKALTKFSGGVNLTIDSVKSIGTGQMAESYRVKFARESRINLDSVVVKVPSQNENSRSASRVTRCYELETNFYASLREHVKVNAPECLHVWYDALSDDFVLVLEDIVGATQGDQISGATMQQAEAAIDQLVSLHSPLWGSEKLNEFTWLPKHSVKSAAGTSQLLQTVFPGFAERFANTVNAEIISLGARLVEKYDRYTAAFPEVMTVTHRDFRLDNLLFTESEKHFDVKVVDWQTVGAMPGACDLGYFIGASFGVDDRRDNEQSLVRRYCEGLHAENISVNYHDIWAQYRLLGTSGYIMAIVASMLVKQTERGDAMFAVMANRHGQQMIDLETEKLFA
jgi:aminoglycoside/choline kinase family phosphotransferase